MPIKTFAIICLLSTILIAQNKDAYESSPNGKSILGLDLSRLTVHNSLSFGAMSGGGYSNLQSQSLYTTMMRYQFTAPVTLNLNFSLPIHSSFSSMQNLTTSNLQSLDYFRSMPLEMSLTWQPTKNMNLEFTVIKPGSGYFGGYGFSSMYRPWGYYGFAPVEQQQSGK